MPGKEMEELRAIYLQYAIQAIEYERRILETFDTLNQAGVDPILVKGWASGRHYAEASLRPSGDIDLYISPQQQGAAVEAINRSACSHYRIDLDHAEFDRFENRSFADVFHRTVLARLGKGNVRIMGAEDHIRLSCLHFLKHGGWRPLWLCDVAAALEQCADTFDWDRCLGTDPRLADWILATVGLAERLLGAEVKGMRPRMSAGDLPRWLPAAVLQQWNRPNPPNHPLFVQQWKEYLRRPWRLANGLASRWPNPIQATVDCDGRFDAGRRLPFQLRNCFGRAAKLVPRVRERASMQSDQESSSPE
jgi:hypothetical protein